MIWDTEFMRRHVKILQCYPHFNHKQKTQRNKDQNIYPPPKSQKTIQKSTAKRQQKTTKKDTVDIPPHTTNMNPVTSGRYPGSIRAVIRMNFGANTLHTNRWSCIIRRTVPETAVVMVMSPSDRLAKRSFTAPMEEEGCWSPGDGFSQPTAAKRTKSDICQNSWPPKVCRMVSSVERRVLELETPTKPAPSCTLDSLLPCPLAKKVAQPRGW